MSLILSKGQINIMVFNIAKPSTWTLGKKPRDWYKNKSYVLKDKDFSNLWRKQKERMK